MTPEAAYDVIIVGAGSAGSVLAARLSEDASLQVLLIEAGPPDRSPLIRVPKGFGLLLGSKRYAWHYPVKTGGPGGVEEQWVRGRTLGGSSAVNGMVYNRGSAPDWDGLADVAGQRWGWSATREAFTSIEDHVLGAGPDRGAGGPLPISIATGLPPVCESTLAAAGTAGLRRTRDINDGDAARIGPAAMTISRGRRVSAARAFLRPARGRVNLTVLTSVVVERLVLAGDRVEGVTVREGRGQSTFRARRRVILCSGGLETPRLLELSGIGDAAVLADAGVEVKVASPRVGEGLAEHRCVALGFRLRGREGYNPLLATRPAQALTAARYLANRRGPMSTSAYDVIGFLDVTDSGRPDAQFLMAPFSALPYRPGAPLGVEREPGMQLIGYPLRPTSRGSVHITGTAGDAPLAIDPGYLRTAYDREVTVGLFRWLRALAASDPLAAHVTAESRPGLEVTSDTEIVDTTLDDGYSGYHAIGTAAMGTDPTAVVDGDLRVRGVEGLSALDASVLPRMVSGNLNGPLMAMAWSAAPMLGERG